MTSFIDSVSYTPPPSDAGIDPISLPFWYLYDSIQKQNGESSVAADFLSQLNTFKTENKDFTGTVDAYNDVSWQTKFARFLAPTTTTDLISLDSTTIQNYILLGYLTQANIDIEYQSELLIKFANVVESALDITSELILLYNKKGSDSFIKGDDKLDYYDIEYDKNSGYTKPIEVVPSDTASGEAQLDNNLIISSDLASDDITRAFELRDQLKELLDSTSLSDSALKTQLQMVYDALPIPLDPANYPTGSQYDSNGIPAAGQENLGVPLEADLAIARASGNSAAITAAENAIKNNTTPPTVAELNIEQWVLWQELPQHVRANETTNGFNSSALQNAATASSNTNDNVKNKLRKTLFVLDEFYKSSSSIISKLHTLLTYAARKIK